MKKTEAKTMEKFVLLVNMSEGRNIQSLLNTEAYKARKNMLFTSAAEYETLGKSVQTQLKKQLETNQPLADLIDAVKDWPAEWVSELVELVKTMGTEQEDPDEKD